MRLREASLLGFRNLAEVQLGFSPGVNIFVGGNGQGKSNLLEALNYPALGRSYRGSPDRELIAFGRETAQARIEAAAEDDAAQIFEFALQRDGGRRFRVDGEALRRKHHLVGRLATVVYDPQTVELVRGGPDNRRRFLDAGLSGLDREYLHHLRCYRRALRHKMRLLRDMRGGYRPDPRLRSDLEIWNREMAEHAVPLLSRRALYVRELTSVATQVHGEFTGGDSRLQLVYSQGVDIDQKDLSEADLKAEILRVFDYIIEDEIKRGRSLAGPHTDDVEIQLEGMRLRDFGSQGETRSAAIALKLAQGELVFRKRRTRPVLFFDDIFSELDRKRSRRLQDMTARDHQIFIATARAEDVQEWYPGQTRRWTIRAGRIEAER
ncbi:DNA replication and repair protein RecF [bacterium]|nr:DNA replication and repair protein RecF [bacterium]MBU1072801.1 DNA replication and repair protein RecF [bacterium]MBU1674879.1 DNA replication and repair protein RecF [bacterium]